MQHSRISYILERCKERGCRSPIFKAGRCRFHHERAVALRIAKRKQELIPGAIPGRDFIYAIEALGQGLVKIGHSGSPRARLKHLSNKSPVKLKLLGYIKLHRSAERLIHQKLKASRSHGEWFHLTSETVNRAVSWIVDQKFDELREWLMDGIDCDVEMAAIMGRLPQEYAAYHNKVEPLEEDQRITEGYDLLRELLGKS